jgi:hypothetical protein
MLGTQEIGPCKNALFDMLQPQMAQVPQPLDAFPAGLGWS